MSITTSRAKKYKTNLHCDVCGRAGAAPFFTRSILQCPHGISGHLEKKIRIVNDKPQYYRVRCEEGRKDRQPKYRCKRHRPEVEVTWDGRPRTKLVRRKKPSTA